MCLLAGRGGVSSDERKEPMSVISQSLGKTSYALFRCYGVGLRERFVWRCDQIGEGWVEYVYLTVAGLGACSMYMRRKFGRECT